MSRSNDEHRIFKTQFTPKEQAQMAGDALCYVLQKLSDEERSKRMSRKLEKLSVIGPLNSAASELETALERMQDRVLDADKLAARSEINGALNRVRNAVSIIMEEFLPERSKHGKDT